MNLEQAKIILKSLEELTVNHWNDESIPYRTAKAQQLLSIRYIKKFIKKLEHQKLRNDLGVGMLDSLSKCEQCGEETFIWKMAGGGECRNPNCDHAEICF